jgi:diguanylate cyclase
VVVTGVHGIVRGWNPAAEELFGWTAEEAIGRGIGSLIAPKRIRSARLAYLLWNATQGKQSPRSSVEALTVHKDGTELTVDINVGSAGKGEDQIWISVIRDRSHHRAAAATGAPSPDATGASELSGSWEWDTSEPRARWNDAMCELFGVEPGFTPTVDEFLELIHPDDRDRVAAAIRLLPDGNEAASTYRIVRTDGEIRHVHTHRMVRPNDSGTVTAAGTMLDITDLVDARETHREAQELFETAFAGAPIGVALVGIDGRFLKVNQALCEMTGMTEAELSTRTFGSLGMPGEGMLDLRGLERLIHGEIPVLQQVLSYERPNGEQILVSLSLSVVRDSLGNALHVIAHAMDITQVRRIEVALAASEARMRAMFEHMPFSMSMRGADGRYELVNQHTLQTFGQTAEEFVGHTPEEVLDPGLAARISALDDAILKTGEPASAEIEITLGGELRVLQLIKFPIIDAVGGMLGIGTVTLDITERKLAEQALVAERRALAEAQQVAHLGSVTWDPETRTGTWSPEMYRLFGLDPADGFPDAATFDTIVHPRDTLHVREQLQRLRDADGTRQVELEYDIVRPDAVVRSLHMVARREDDGRLFATVQDVTELRRAEREARQERDRSEAIVAAMGEGYALILDGEIRTVNDALCRLTGFSREELVGSTAPFPFWPPASDEDALQLSDEIFSRRGGTFEVKLVRAGGDRFEAEITARAAHDDDGRMLGFVCTIRDVSQRKRQQAELEWLARTDSLTGLANRRVLVEALGRETQLARRHGRPLSLVLLDIDHFKRVNDKHGHPAGDAVLVEIARRLLSTMRSGETLARVGGEEFAWLLPATDAAGAVIAAERARQAVEAETFPGVGDLTISAGVSTVSGNNGYDGLYKAADRALYLAKQTGRNRTVHDDPQLTLHLPDDD